eukprot:scaffold100974_cov13-Tisochrysis_lutea.AAC.1
MAMHASSHIEGRQAGLQPSKAGKSKNPSVSMAPSEAGKSKNPLVSMALLAQAKLSVFLDCHEMLFCTKMMLCFITQSRQTRLSSAKQ